MPNQSDSDRISKLVDTIVKEESQKSQLPVNRDPRHKEIRAPQRPFL